MKSQLAILFTVLLSSAFAIPGSSYASSIGNPSGNSASQAYGQGADEYNGNNGPNQNSDEYDEYDGNQVSNQYSDEYDEYDGNQVSNQDPSEYNGNQPWANENYGTTGVTEDPNAGNYQNDNSEDYYQPPSSNGSY